MVAGSSHCDSVTRIQIFLRISRRNGLFATHTEPGGSRDALRNQPPQLQPPATPSIFQIVRPIDGWRWQSNDPSVDSAVRANELGNHEHRALDCTGRLPAQPGAGHSCSLSNRRRRSLTPDGEAALECRLHPPASPTCSREAALARPRSQIRWFRGW